MAHSVYQKWLDIFPKSPKHVFFFIDGSPVVLKKVIFFSGSSLEGLEVGDVEQSLAACSPKCGGCCVCQCGSTTLETMILAIMQSSSSSALT